MRTSFYVIIFGFIVGVFWRSFFELHIYGVVAVLLWVLCVLGVSVLVKPHNSVGYGILFVLLMVLGIVRTEFAYKQYQDGYAFTEGEKVYVNGTVISEPDMRDEYTVLFVEIHNETSTRIRVIADQFTPYAYGDVVKVEGNIKIPNAFKTDTGRMFDYRGYLQKDGIHYQVTNADVTKTGAFNGSMVRKKLYVLKHAWLDSVNTLIPEPEASLAGGVTVGAKNSLGSEWLDAFRDTGIIHIVVLSGYNLTLIANSVVRMTLTLPKGIGFGLGTLGVVGFASMVGAGATVVRASIMAILGMLSTFLNRPYTLLRALLLAGFAMVLSNPFILVNDPGFQLSFIATAGLIFISPYFEKMFVRIPESLGLRAIVAATFATQLAVLPLLMFQMGRVSLVAPIVNILILPLVPLVMLTSFLTGLLDMSGTFLAVPFAFISHSILTYMFYVVELFNTLPFAAITLPLFPWWGMVFLYLLGILFLIKNKTSTQLQ